MRSLLDTHVLVYADAADQPVRQAQAIALIAGHLRDGSGVLSTQVLQEFVNVALRKLRLPPDLIREWLAFYTRFEVVPASPDLIRAALDLHVLHRLSYSDTLIVQAAVDSGCQRVLSEDLQDGFTYRGVRVTNPFRETA